MAKKSKGKNIVLVILILVIISLMGYILYDSFFTEEEASEIKNEIKEEKENLDEVADVDKMFKNVYNIDLNHKDVNCFNNDGTKEYVFADNEHNHGGMMIRRPEYIKLNNVEKQKDEYSIIVTTLYASFKDHDFIAADAKGTIKIADFDSYFNEDGSDVDINKAVSDYENTFESRKTEYPKYKFTFKKNQDDYYLTKYEIVS